MKLVEVLFFAYLVLFPFGQLTRLSLSFLSEEVHIYGTDVILVVFLVVGGLWFWIKKESIKFPSLALPIFTFVFFALSSLLVNLPLLSPREIAISSLYLLRWSAYAAFYFLLFNLKRRLNLLKWRNLSGCLTVVGTTSAIFGLIQYILWPDLRALEVFEWDPHYYRVVGTFLDPGFTGLLFVLTLILIISLGWRGRKKWRFLIGGGVVYLALVLTYSRSSYLAYVVGMGIISLVKKSPRFFVLVLMVGCLTLLVLPRPGGEGVKLERTTSSWARVENWQHSLVIARRYPILGVGFNAYRYAQRRQGFLGEKWQTTHAGAGADSSLLFVLATTGALGLIAYLWIWVRALRTKNLVVLASLGAIFIHSFFLNSLFYPWIMGWIWILLAMENS